tara:strand:- start:4073 stop:4216 length:144 start_codon:yes stop_codon:yes gene_type:complete
MKFIKKIKEMVEKQKSKRILEDKMTEENKKHKELVERLRKKDPFIYK